ncbi:hypothetical protein [Boudabousia liubingyangii]|nr:hypothetical protein [Boudabousia liubingyangii]
MTRFKEATMREDKSERDFEKEFAQLIGDDQAEESSKVPESEKNSDLPEVAYGEIPENLVIEEVRPMEDGHRRVGVIVTELRSALLLEEILKEAKLKARALGTESGAVAWVDITSADDEFSELMGPERPLAPELDQVGKALSELLGREVLGLQSWLSQTDPDAIDEGESAVVGQLVAWRYLNGKAHKPLSAGMVVAYLDPRIEDLLVGRTDPLTHDFPVEEPPSIWRSFKNISKNIFNQSRRDQ